MAVHSDAIAQLNFLCIQCKVVSSGIASNENSVTQHQSLLLYESFRDLISSAQRGCHLCTLLQTRIQTIPECKKVYEYSDDHELDRRFQIDDPIYLHWEAKHEADIELHVSYLEAPQNSKPTWFDQRYYSYIRIWIGKWSNLNASNHYQPHSAHRNLQTSSPEHFELGRFWLQECLQKHQGCQLGLSVRAPSRLIDLTDADSSSLVRLHVVEGTGKPPRYCALSHCWGKNTDILKLSSDNIFAWRSQMPASPLAKTFQHAIAATRALGLRFLWIDCLCIIQDSREDWLRESARMGDIFEGAVCCIAAAATQGAEDGIFRTRNPMRYLPCLITAAPENELFAYPQGHPPEGEELRDCQKDSPLFKRGWVFQETMLSLRTILFTSRGIFWSCRYGVASELSPCGCGKGERSKHDGIKLFKPSVEIFGPSIQRLLEKPGSEHFEVEGPTRAHFEEVLELAGGEKARSFYHQAWYRLLQGYFERLLTKPEDKLIAISGIAERIKKENGFTYLAGLWKETFLYDLLWAVSDDSGRKADKYRAPSWSWASVNGPILTLLRMASGVNTAMAKVKHIDVLTHSLDNHKTGQVTGAELRLFGRLKKFFGISIGPRRSSIWSSAKTFTGNWQAVHYLLDEHSSQACDPILFPILSIKDSRGRYEGAEPEKTVYGLVLHSEAGRCYRRIGTFRFEDHLIPGGPPAPDTYPFEKWEEQDIIIV